MNRRFTYSDQWLSFEERAKQLLALEEDWDSYGAKKINPNAIKRAEKFLSIVKPEVQPLIYPLASGGVTLSFEYGDDPEAVMIDFCETDDEDLLYVEMGDE